MRRMMLLAVSVCAAALGIALMTGCGGATASGDVATQAADQASEPLWVLSHETTSSDTVGTVSSEIVLELDERGNRLGQTTTYEGQDSIEMTFEVDENGYPVQMTASTGGATIIDAAVTNELDDQGRLVKRTSPGVEISYAYDEAGTLVQATIAEAGESDETNPSTTTIELRPDGFVSTEHVERADAVIDISFAYETDDQGRPVKGTCTSLVDDDPDSELVTTYTYTYDENGNLASQVVEGLMGTTTTTYEYVEVSDPSPSARHFAATAQI